MSVVAARSAGPQIGRFFELFLSHRKGEHAGEPFVLEPWQQRFLDEFFEVDEDGRRVYKFGYLGVPRGNGKTPLAAGLGLYELLTKKDSPDVFTIAGAKDQARLLFDFAKGFVEDNEQLGGPEGRGWVLPGKSLLSCYENHGVMKVLASSGVLLHGLNPSCALIDELHALMYDSQEEAFNAVLTALHKRPNSYMLTITTAGFDKDTLLGRAYDQALGFPDGEDELGGCLRIRRDRENGVLFWWFGVPENRAEEWENEELWRDVNPASWVYVPDLRKQLNAPGLHDLDFRRLHLNMWTATRDAWLPSGVWNSCRSDRKIPDGAAIHAGVDVGLYHDTTAVSWAWRDPRDDKVVVRTRVWATQPELAHHVYVPGGRMRLELVTEFLKELAEDYQLMEVVYDPAMFAAEADRIDELGIAEMYELHQAGGAIQAAYQGFYQAAKEGSICHDGDPVLAQHIESTAADLTERGWRPRKLKSSMVIDACVATAWAHHRAALAEGPSVYEREGLFSLDVPFDEDDDED